MLAYASGLRLSELCHLRVGDIDSHADRMCLRVEQGKGGKDRFVPLAEDVLQLLRECGRHRPACLPQAARFRCLQALPTLALKSRVYGVD